ncbi:MAG: hypothetical protein PWP24_340 [Clostridiales bacterium]|nr:hypothetical protein [Clostridiales bacterium]
MSIQKSKTLFFSMCKSIFGVFLFAFAYRLIIVSLHLYNGGFSGIAQILQILLRAFLPVPIPNNLDLTGLLLTLLNIPLFILAYKSISRQFFTMTIITVLIQSFFMSVIPIPSKPIFHDTLTGCIVGGIISGLGVGITLKAGSSGGGTDIVGVYCAKRFPGVSVGKISLILNGFVYLFGAFRDNIETAVYSAIFSLIASVVLDKVHYQNIKTSALIITKSPDIGSHIIHQLRRGVTTWTGFGGYTKEPTYINMTVISKNEVPILKHIIAEIDSNAFITFNDRLDVSGNFEKRFDI